MIFLSRFVDNLYRLFVDCPVELAISKSWPGYET